MKIFRSHNLFSRPISGASKSDLLIIITILAVAVSAMSCDAGSKVVQIQEEEEAFIQDRTGERWEVTQAKSLGFDPEKFQYGLGRHAFTPLDDSSLEKNPDNVDDRLRVIGVADGSAARAYSVSKLSRHEVANSFIGSTPIAAAY